MSDKPFKSYKEQLQLLLDRGMEVEDQARALRKLSEIGYYRLSGFWYPCRKFQQDPEGNLVPSPVQPKVMLRTDEFYPGTSFDKLLELYLFDKKLRLLMLDALERVEIYMRVLIAHEMGKLETTAHKNVAYINPRWTTPAPDSSESFWDTWCKKLKKQLAKSKEDCIQWYQAKSTELPIWVSIQVWEFGTMSKYFSMLNGRYQRAICRQIHPYLQPWVLSGWLDALNILRNRCAHHGRIWNQPGRPLPCPMKISYFVNVQKVFVDMDRMGGLIAVLWFLVHHLGNNSTWLERVKALLEKMPELPRCDHAAMGFGASLDDTFDALKHSI